jgi:hypothetical protein
MEADMAIVIIQEPPIPITAEMYDTVNEKMGIENEPPTE